jgi:transcriptional regulator with XRE-family HTH domain
LEIRAKKPRPEAYPRELKTYGDHLRAKRLDLGFLQGQVAAKIGVNETTVYNWENNRVAPSVRLIPQIIQFLGYCPYTPGLPLSGKLKIWRQSLGFSQEKVATALGVDEGTWRRWEAGQRQPAPKYWGRINIFLDSPERVTR